jgi:hypothetical protein
MDTEIRVDGGTDTEIRGMDTEICVGGGMDTEIRVVFFYGWVEKGRVRWWLRWRERRSYALRWWK